MALVTTLSADPGHDFQGRQPCGCRAPSDGTLLPPMWFVGLHDLMSGHIWAQLPRPDLPPSVAASERAFEAAVPEPPSLAAPARDWRAAACS